MTRDGAVQMGRTAFASGIGAARALDVAFCNARLGQSNTLELLEGWTEGWHAANLEAPVPGLDI